LNGNAKDIDAYWQYIRGICIICVILIHCKTGVGYENNLIGSWNFDYWLIFRQFINFPVAVFIFLAGYFTNIEKAKKGYITYITNRGGETPSIVFDVVRFLYAD